MPKTVRFHELGGPEVLRIEETPLAKPNPGEVRVAVRAIGLNRVEALYRSGGFGTPTFPARIGYEAAGIVDALGPGVAGVSVGDRVAVLPGIAMDTHGTYGDMILLPADMLVPVPVSQSFEAAAATWMPYVTAFPLHEAGIAPGDAVIVTAASSSVGLAAIQIVRAAGGLPIAATRTRAKVNALLEHGAAHVVVTDEEDLVHRVRTLTGGRGAAIAFDAVAGAGLASLAAALAPGGTIILYGTLGGETIALDAQPLMMGGLTLRGYAAFQVVMDPERRAAAIAAILAGLASGRFAPIIDRIFGFADIVAAHRRLESNTQIGKVVVTLDRRWTRQQASTNQS